MAERQRGSSEQSGIMQNNQDIVRDITSTIQGTDISVASSAMRISPELAQRLQDPAAQQELLDLLHTTNPDYSFTGITVIPPDEAGDGHYHIQVSMNRLAKVSIGEMVSDLRSSLDSFGSGFQGTTMPVTSDLFHDLHSETNQVVFTREFEAANPGFTCRVIGFIPQFQTKDGSHHVKLAVERVRTDDSVRTRPDVVDDVGAFIHDNLGINLSGTTLIISPELARTLQNPTDQTRLILALQRDYPQYNFSLTLLNPGQVSDDYHLQVHMRPRRSEQ
ncbi:MAG: hypothetical protein ABH983_03365 [Candidatus Micrarchaeota archaeon]